MVANKAIWWGIYVGTQQEHQPDEPGTGCSFLFPLPGTQCPLQPRVPVTNLVLRNVTMTHSLLSVGLIRAANLTQGTGVPGYRPATGWVFDNVHMSSITNWPVGKNYMCDGVYNATFTDSSPVPSCQN